MCTSNQSSYSVYIYTANSLSHSNGERQDMDWGKVVKRSGREINENI